MGRGKKQQQEINASSMADIAFLLLIFFLVTTTIDQDKGIIHGLPPWTEEEPPDVQIKDRDVLEILVNSADQLLVESEYISVDRLREITVKHITNNGKLPNYSVSPLKAVVSLKNDRGTSYGLYVKIQNELKGAYTEVRDEMADKLTGGKYTYAEINARTKKDAKVTDAEKLQSQAWKKEIKESYPMLISEAEPVNYGGN